MFDVDQLLHAAIKQVRTEREVEKKDNVFFMTCDGDRGHAVNSDPISVAEEIQNAFADVFDNTKVGYSIYNNCNVSFDRKKFLQACDPFSRETNKNGMTFIEWYEMASKNLDHELFYHYAFDAWLTGLSPKDHIK